MPTDLQANQKPQAPVDTSTPTPKAVRDAAAKANAYYKPPAGDPQSASVAASPQEQPTVAQQVTPTAPTSVAAPMAASPEQPAPQQNWEQAYKSMKGRYDKSQEQIRSLETSVSQNGGEVMALQGVVQRLQQQLNQLAGQQPAPRANNGRLITAEDEKDYGADFIDVVRRAAREISEPHVQQLQAKVAELEGEIGKNTYQGVLDQLDRTVPQWRQVNEHPRFLSWLKLRDPYSGAMRHQMLSQAFEAADAPRVIAFFKGFLTDEATTAPQEPTPQPAPQARQPAMQLDSLAAPGRARTAPTTLAADKPAFTVADIRKFYEDVRKGYYAGRESDKTSIEHQIFAAQREGRVRG